MVGALMGSSRLGPRIEDAGHRVFFWLARRKCNRDASREDSPCSCYNVLPFLTVEKSTRGVYRRNLHNKAGRAPATRVAPRPARFTGNQKPQQNAPQAPIPGTNDCTLPALTKTPPALAPN